MANMYSSYLVLTIGLLTLSPLCLCDMFTAIRDMENVLHVEYQLAQDIRTYIQEEESRLEQLRAWVLLLIRMPELIHCIKVLTNRWTHGANRHIKYNLACSTTNDVRSWEKKFTVNMYLFFWLLDITFLTWNFSRIAHCLHDRRAVENNLPNL